MLRALQIYQVDFQFVIRMGPSSHVFNTHIQSQSHVLASATLF